MSPTPVMNEYPAQKAQSAQFISGLHASLDVQKVLQKFLHAIHDDVSCDGLHYINPEQRLDITVGETENTRFNHLQYQLNVQQESLGSLKFIRSKSFNPQDIYYLETMVAVLLSPLGNALEYHAAIQSALTDPLTGLNNRSSLKTQLKREIELAKRHNQQFSILALDLDYFKQVNDTYGHQGGDATLQEFSQLLITCVRETDLLYRLGGEEFLAVLPNTDIHGAVKLADRIRKSMAAHITHHDEQEIQTTVSVGVASYISGDTSDGIVSRSDKALYRAKQQGRNQVSV